MLKREFVLWRVVLLLLLAGCSVLPPTSSQDVPPTASQPASTRVLPSATPTIEKTATPQPVSPGNATATTDYIPIPDAPGTKKGCLEVRRYEPDSDGALKFSNALTAAYQALYPDQEIAIEQLFFIDQMGGYAVLQARTSDEDFKIFVLSQEDRTYRLMAEWSRADHAGAAPEDIITYLKQSVPAAPPELFDCLDLLLFSLPV